MSSGPNKEGGPLALPTADTLIAAMAAGAGYDTRTAAWTTGKQRTPAPNRAAIRAAKAELVRWLRRHGRAHPDLAAIGERIAACGRRRLRDRCGHPACPRCGGGALQRLLVQILWRYLASRVGEPWMTVSIILPPRDPDGTIDFAAEREPYGEVLRAAGITHGVFGLDASWNEDQRRELPEEERFADHVSVHLYGLAPAVQAIAAKPILKRLMPPSNAVPRPVKMKLWDGGLTALAYVLKGTFQRRQTILKFDERRGELVRDTRDRGLTVEQRIQAVRALDRAGLTGRIVLLGLRVDHGHAGQLRLIPTH